MNPPTHTIVDDIPAERYRGTTVMSMTATCKDCGSTLTVRTVPNLELAKQTMHKVMANCGWNQHQGAQCPNCLEIAVLKLDHPN